MEIGFIPAPPLVLLVLILKHKQALIQRSLDIISVIDTFQNACKLVVPHEKKQVRARLYILFSVNL